MVSSFEDWGQPHGIAGSITATTYEEYERQAKAILFYRMNVTYNGGLFELFREKHHSTENVQDAKNWLRRNQDVVAINVVLEV